MTSIPFEEAKQKIAEHQEEYQTIHCNLSPLLDDEGKTMNMTVMTACYELSGEEIQDIMLNKRIWYQQLIPKGGSMQPMTLRTTKPVI